MPTYTIGESPVVVDSGGSTLIQIQNTGTAQLLCEPLGRRVPAGNTQTVPGYSQQPTTLRTAPGSTTTAVVTLTAGSPAVKPGPGFVRFDPGAAASMVLSVSGGGVSWYADEGLTTAATFPTTVSTATTLWPSTEGTVTITATVGNLTKTAGMTILARGNPAFVFTPKTATDTTAQELGQDGVSAGSRTYAQFGVTQGALYVDQVNGLNTNDGLSPGAARKTIQHAVNALPSTGGEVQIAPGTYAESVTIDATSSPRSGITLRGRGAWATIITPPSGDGIKFISGSGATNAIQMVRLENLGVVSAPGNGINLGGSDWVALGNVTLSDVRTESCGGHGVLGHDINEVTFKNARSRSNAGCGFYFSSKSGDQGAVDPVATGNTWVLINCGTYGNAGDGIQLNQVGNSVTIIGGELHDSITAGTYGFNLIPGASTRGVRLIGVHFEHNHRGVHLGDNAANSFNATSVTFDSCSFLQSIDGIDVYLDGSDGTIFENCQFGGSTAGIQVSNTSSNRYYLNGLNLGTNSTKLLKQRNGTVWDKVVGVFGWGGRLRLINDSSGFADSVSTALIYLQNNQSTAKMIEMNDATGSVFVHAGAGTPEGAVTAGPGSMYLRRDGSTSTSLYVKETGTGNTGWVAK